MAKDIYMEMNLDNIKISSDKQKMVYIHGGDFHLVIEVTGEQDLSKLEIEEE